MSLFKFSDECLKTLEVFRNEYVLQCQKEFKNFKSNTLGLKLDEDSKEYYCDKEYLKKLILKVPNNFKIRLENALKPFMKSEDKEWMDIFRFFAFICFESKDNTRVLADMYNEGGLNLSFYNGVIKEPNIKAYEALFKTLDFLSIEELCGLKNIVEDGYFNEEEILNEFFEYEDFLYAFLILRDMIDEHHFSIICNRYHSFDFLSSEEIFEDLNEKLEKNGVKRNGCFFVEKGFYAKKNLTTIVEVEELFDDADFSLLNSEEYRLEFLIKKLH